MPTLIHRLGDNSIGAAGAVALGKALETNSTLTSIGYAASCSVAASAPPDGACLLARSLDSNQLCGINLFGNGTYSAEGITEYDLG